MLLKLFVHCKVFLQRKDGASGIEYAVIAAMVAVVLAGFVPGISESVTNIMTEIKDALVVPPAS
ncbi:Flp family type IVb pilin [Pseudomonas guariconensis]|uniref:Flp family type IVb pilin n=1 Tax=Pseudomonas guariconensis TaxID=1288410 RepID=UPI0018A90A05|nr:Flp family type IVb pilin [Pseudomonas guariconensis]MBF8723715.1 Flp family type IVb pilin [Pseudomonas guariconensis]